MSTNSQEPAAEKAAILPVSTIADIGVGVRYRHAMKLELGMDVSALRHDWAARETAYFAERTANGGAQWYLARVGPEFVGSSCAYVDDSWWSALQTRPRTGWIIGVYVVPAHRRRGIARSLTDAAVQWLRSAGCAEAKLHASAFGRGIYESLGFTLTNEMKRSL